MREFKGNKFMYLSETKTGKFKVVDDCGFSIATATGYGNTDKANMLLFSCSTEMLEMLQMHIDQLDLSNYDFYEKYGFNSSELMPRTRELITKATEV